MNTSQPGITRLRTNDTSYSDIVTLQGPGAIIYVAGQLAFDADRQIVGTSVADQATVCFDRIEELLGRAGAGLCDVVRITTYMTDLDGYAEFDTIRAARFGDHRPASSLVGVAELLFGALVEIEAIAFVTNTQPDS